MYYERKNNFISYLMVKPNNHTITVTKLLRKVIVNNVPMVQVDNKLLWGFAKDVELIR